MNDTPVVVLYDENGVPMAVEDGAAIPAGTRGTLIAGTDGSDAHVVKVTVDSRLVVDGSEVIQPVSVTSLPLPTNAATESTLSSISGDTANLDVLLSSLDPLTDTQLRATAVGVTGPLTDSELRATPVDVLGPLTDSELRASDVGITAASLPLPTGASTEATLALIKAKTDNIDVALSTRAVTGLTDSELRATAVPVGDGGGSLTVDGPLTDSELRASAVPVSASSLPLPTGAATAALQTQPGVDIGDVTINNASGASAVNVQDGGNSITVDAPVGTPVAARLSDGSSFYDGTKTGQLPSALVGARLDTNTGAWLGSTSPTVGQKTSTDSIPVVISSDQTPVKVQGTVANAAAAADNPLQLGGVDSAGNIRRLLTQLDGVLRVKPTNHAAFSVTAPAVVLGNNKSMISLVNSAGSAVIVRLREIYIINTQNSNVSGVVTTMALRRITGHSAGTAITPLPHDSSDSLVANVTAITGSTVAGEATGFLRHWVVSSDEWGAGALDTESFQQTNQTLLQAYHTRDTAVRPVTLRAGEGITIKCETNTVDGSFDLVIVFTQENE